MAHDKIRIKICGIRTPDIAEFTVYAGADALGFVFFDKSPRNVSVEEAYSCIRDLPPFVSKVGVFADKKIEEILEIVEKTGLDTIQLHGEEKLYTLDFIRELKKKTNLPVMLGIRLEKLDENSLREIIRSADNTVNAYLIDKYDPDQFGGTGSSVALSTFQDQSVLKFLKERIILAGGINAGNLSKVLDQVRPYAIDVSSGVERERGVKDKTLIREFIETVKNWQEKRETL